MFNRINLETMKCNVWSWLIDWGPVLTKLEWNFSIFCPRTLKLKLFPPKIKGLELIIMVIGIKLMGHPEIVQMSGVRSIQSILRSIQSSGDPPKLLFQKKFNSNWHLNNQLQMNVIWISNVICSPSCSLFEAHFQEPSTLQEVKNKYPSTKSWIVKS